jgi:hypothetical protein
MFCRWNEQAGPDGKKIRCIIVLGLTNDIKFCSEKTASTSASEYPRNVGYLLDQLETVLGGWACRMDCPVVYASGAASYREDPRKITSDVRLDNLNTSSQPKVQHARALGRLYNFLDQSSTAGPFPDFLPGRVYMVQKPMTDFNRCDWVGHPHLTELYTQACYLANTVFFVLQKSKLRSNMKCKYKDYWDAVVL